MVFLSRAAGGTRHRTALVADVAKRGLDPTTELAVVELLRTARDLEAVFAAELAPYSLSLSRFAILMELHTARDQQLSQSALGERLVVVPSNVTKQVDALEARGLVTRVPSVVDRRMTFVQLTPAGAALLEQIVPRHYAGQERLLAHLAPAERATLVRLLEAVQQGAVETAAEIMAGRRGPAARRRTGRSQPLAATAQTVGAAGTSS